MPYTHLMPGDPSVIGRKNWYQSWPSLGPVAVAATAPFICETACQVTSWSGRVATVLDGDLVIRLTQQGAAFPVDITHTIASGQQGFNLPIAEANRQTLLPGDLLAVEVVSFTATNAADLIVAANVLEVAL